MKITEANRVTSIPARVVRDEDVRTIVPGTALVAVDPAPECRPASRHSPHHDAFFVAQLIAVAQHSPQTRPLRRATPQDARTAYQSTTAQNRTATQIAPRTSLVA